MIQLGPSSWSPSAPWFGRGGALMSGLLAVACCALTVLAVAKRARFLFRLRGVPGPRALPLLGNAIELTATQENFFHLMGRCAATYGPMYRLWVGTRPFIFLQSAEAVQPILNSSVHIDKSPDYRFVEAWIGTGLVTSTGEKWRRRRKLLTPSFHSRVLDEFLVSLFREAGVLADKLASHSGGAPFDVVPYSKLAALDIICDTALGKHIGAQRNSSNAYVVAVDRITSIVQRRFITPWLKPDALFRLSELGRAQKQCVEIIHGFTRRVFEARKLEKQSEWDSANQEAQHLNEQPHPQQQIHKQDSGVETTAPTDKSQGKPRRRLALLDLLLDMAHQGADLSDEDIREEVDTFTFAGHDTTAAGFSWCLYVLGKHPKVQERVVEEWRDVWARARSRSSDGEAALTVADLTGLDYTERCIKEVLRLYPVVPLIARDIRSPVKILGEEIPAGCTILLNTYLLHRDDRFFPQPEVFDPDRFLSDCETKRHPFAYVPFSAGSRNCIGQRFAMLELKVLLGSILERFQVHSSEPESSLRLVAELVLNNVGGIKVSLTPRT